MLIDLSLEECKKFLMEEEGDSPCTSFHFKQLVLKLMLHEFCGWIEESLDEIYLLSAREPLEKKEIKEYIKPLSSFAPEQFRKTLMFCLGVSKLLELEQNWPPENKANFENSLKELITVRNSISHTYYRPERTKSYLGYSTIEVHKKKIEAGLEYLNTFISSQEH